MSTVGPAALCGISSNIYRASFYFHSCCPIVDQRQRCRVILKYPKKAKSYPVIFRSVVTKVKSEVNNGDSGATKHTRSVLERLFAKTQKLEEMVSRNSSFSSGAELTMNLEILGRDLQTVLSNLRKKEEDFKDAERRVLQEQARLNSMKHDMEQQEKDIATAFANQRQLEGDVETVNSGLASKSTQIEDLSFQLEQQSRQIISKQSLLAEKENELNGLEDQLMKKNKEVDNLRLQLDLKEKNLDRANSTIKDQEAMINNLQEKFKEKEYELFESVKMRNSELERLKIMEADFEKQTTVWLLARDELRQLTEQASENLNDMKETSEDFNRVRSLLSTVRSELVSMQESLAMSRRKMEDKEHQLEKKLAELDEKKFLLISYCQKLESARIEFETERTEMMATRAQYQELELQVSSDMKKIQHLEEELNAAKTSLEQRVREISVLKDVILQKEVEYADIQNLLQVKESELVETRLQIQLMESEMASLQLILQEKDASLLKAQEELTQVNYDIIELQRLMSIQEEKLTQATMLLQEREEHILELRQELHDTKFKVSEATSIVQHVAQLTEELVSAREEAAKFSLINESDPLYIEHDAGDEDQDLKTTLEKLKDSLRIKEVEIFSAKRDLVAKEEELQVVLRRWETGGKETQNISEDLDADTGVKRVCRLARGKLCGGSEAIEIGKIQNEVAQLEAEAATVALQNLEDLIHHLTIQSDFISSTLTFSNASVSPMESAQLDDNHVSTFDKKFEGLRDIAREIVRLFALTEQLVVEAGINHAGLQ